MAVKKQKNPEETTKIQQKIKKDKVIKFDIQLNDEQKEAKRKILANKITILTGKAGSGKSQLAVATAIDLLFKGEIKRIYITRPVVVREELGFLPGGIAEKLDPFLIPIYDCLRTLYSDEVKIKQMFLDKVIDIAPIAFMRGRTVKDAVMIIDEAQNCMSEDLKMCLTRLGNNGKIIVCGDEAQIDLKHKSQSGLEFLTTLSEKIEGFAHVKLLVNHRDPIVDDILKHYEIEDLAQKTAKTIHAHGWKKTAI